MGYCYFRIFPRSKMPSTFASDIELYSSSALDVYNYVYNNVLTGLSIFSNNNYIDQTKFNLYYDTLEQNINYYFSNPSSYTQPTVIISCRDRADYELYFSGKRFKFFSYIFSNNSPNKKCVLYDVRFKPLLPSDSWTGLNEADCNFSIIGYDVNNLSELANDISYTKSLWGTNNFGTVPDNYFGRFEGLSYDGVCQPDTPSCDDSRTSDDTQTLHFVISDGVSNAQTFDVSFNLSDGANQEIGLLSPVLSDSAFNALLNVWNSQTGCTARCQFISGTVRSSCRVKLVCKVYGQSCQVSPSLVPPFVQLQLSEYGGVNAIDRNLLIADFDPCQDTAVSYSEDVTSYIQGLQQNEDFSVGFSFIQVVPYKVVIENCTALTDYCCDDDESVPADDESLGGYTKPLIQGYGGGSSSGGGGGDVDITCICTALSNINDTLSAFASANETALSGINDTLLNMNIELDNECICNNLENVVDGLGAIKDSIDDKELSVINSPNINVAPCQPIVTNPVNNITVTPSTAQITNPVTVQPCSPIVTNPVNNITVTPSTADVNVNIDNSGIESALSNINSNLSGQNDSLMCDDKGLACILKEALNTSDLVSESVTDVIKNALNTSDNESEGLTDVIKNKDFGSNIDVEVSPADDVNINRVYYTNQRNGDTNL